MQHGFCFEIGEWKPVLGTRKRDSIERRPFARCGNCRPSCNEVAGNRYFYIEKFSFVL